MGLDLDFECLLDGVLLGSCDSIPTTETVPGVPYQVEVEEFAYGRHTLEIRAVDEFGNVDPTPAKQTWTYIDVTAPETSIEVEPPAEETEGTIAIFEFIGEAIDGSPVFDFECALDGADFQYCTSPHTIEHLTVGPHYFEVRAVGPSGNRDSTPELYEWLVIPPVDTVGPVVSIEIAPGAVSGPDVIFGFAANELVEEFECILDNESWTGCDSILEMTALEPGPHTLEVRGYDIWENVGPSDTHSWTSVGEPDTTITHGPGVIIPEIEPDTPITASSSATFEFESDQANVTFQCSVDGSPAMPCTSPYTAGLLGEGDHSFEVWAVSQFKYIDGTPVMDMEPAIYEWLVQDNIPPETFIPEPSHEQNPYKHDTNPLYLPLTDLENPNTLRFILGGTDNGTSWLELTFECSLDGLPYEECERIFYLEYEELVGTDHVLLVRAMDMFENVDPTPVVYEWQTDGNPDTEILTGPELVTGETSATFTVRAWLDETRTEQPLPGTTFQCSLDLAPFTACPSPLTYTNLPFGPHELLVRAVGPQGTADLEPEVYEWEVGDATPAVVTIQTGPDIATLETTATFTFTVDDPAAKATCSLDGGPFKFCESPVTYLESDLRGLNPGQTPRPLSGQHTLTVDAVKQ
ncbi:MAG TPA: hypothetical protein VGZ51_00940, partial [Actinomycetota bacterium]|nr:hypothetical protein [Actinomycetota bacterium]